MMKHAFLIIAHNEYPILEVLLSMLDDERNDIYLHIDKRAVGLYQKIKGFKIKKAGFYLIEKNMKVYWGDISLVNFSKKLGIEEGTKLLAPTLEFSYKNDDLGDPMINDYFAIAIGAATREEIDKITEYTFKVNEVLRKFFDEAGIELIDFKIEFGRFHGEIILADEISPDTCRLWDKETHEKLDKDRFRRDMGNVEDAYQEVFRRIGIK